MTTDNNRAEEFLDLYRQLESAVKEAFPDSGTSPISWLTRRRDFRYLSSDLDYCREVRNLLSHREKVKGAYAVEPSEAMVETLRETFDKIVNPMRAHHIMVGRKQVVAKNDNDLVRPVMATMLERKFSHVPILKGERVVGVFSETLLLKCLVEDEMFVVSGDMRFRDLGEGVLLENQVSEKYLFAKRRAFASDIADMFDRADRSEDRIGMVFVTENGKPTERLLGIITAWDVASLSREARCYIGSNR